MLVTTEEMFKEAEAGRYAIPAPNFYDAVSLKAYVDVAESLGQPLIAAFAHVHQQSVDLSLGDVAALGQHLAKQAKVPVALHLDHGGEEHYIRQAIDFGFSSVMIDASQKPFDENVAITQRVVAYAHQHGVVVEAEIGHVGSGTNYENHEMTDSIYTEVADAVRFVELTGVDSLAVSIGTAHGVYKGKPKINFDRLAELKEKVGCPLVLHGGSSSGDDNLRRCARGGMRKINIFTDIIQGGMAKVRQEQPEDLLRLNQVRAEGMKEVLRHYYEVFGCVKEKGGIRDGR